MLFNKRNSKEKGEKEKLDRKKELSLDSKDYIAITIVTLESLLPFILLIVILIVIALLLRIF